MAYERIHPVVTVSYMLAVTIPAAFSGNPVLAAIALSGVLLLMRFTEPERPKPRSVLLLFGLVLLTTVCNPLFSHKGETELFFLNDRAITLEALLYGAGTGICLASVLLWFHSFNTLVGTEKILALTGRAAPKTTLLLTSALRFVPSLRRKADTMRRTQRSFGLYGGESAGEKLSGGAHVYSMLVTDALEQAGAMSKAMKARGYGLSGRTTYSLYRFRRRDGLLLCWIALLFAGTIAAMACGGFAFRFYPHLEWSPGNIGIFGTVCYSLLSLTGGIIEIQEGLLWSYYKSKI